MSSKPVPALRRRLLAGGAAAAALGVVGLSGLSTPSAQAMGRRPGGAAGGTPLTVAAFPAVDDIVRAALPSWQARHPGVRVRVVSRQFGDHHTAMTTALSTASHLPDVMALEVGFVGRFARGVGLDNLLEPPYGIAAYRDRFVPYAWDQATTARGAVVAVPTDIGPGTLLYRSDVLARAGLTTADLTRSWEGYVAAGVQLKAATGGYLLAHARDLKDLLIRTGIQPGQGLYFDTESRVLVNSPRFVRAFELAREVRRHRLDARVAAWSNEWAEGFRRGTLATQLSGAWLAGHMNNWLAPDTAGLWRAAPLPEDNFAAYGGTSFAIPRGAVHKTLAWDLIRHLTLDRERQLEAFRTQDAFPALLETYDDPFFEQPIAFLGGQPARALWRDAARRVTAVQVHKHDSFAGEVIDTALDRVLDRGKDIAVALADAERLLARRALR
jgi:multiple sugar transport system substrate-binding protein